MAISALATHQRRCGARLSPADHVVVLRLCQP
jgi:hypothetical protein